jgi:transcriptional regulator with PAS, ATPase and Fis domain
MIGDVTDLWRLANKLENLRRPWTMRKARQCFERVYVDLVMYKYQGDRQKVCKALDISLSALKEKLQKGYGGRR